MSSTEGPRRAFLTYSARARGAVSPILESAEALLHDLGWRTRLPRRPAPGSVDLPERRRLRLQSYGEVERSDVVVHLPSPAAFAGTQLNRELNQAVRQRRPIVLLLGSDLREVHGIGFPEPERLEHLGAVTGGRVVATLADFSELLCDWPALASQR